MTDDFARGDADPRPSTPAPPQSPTTSGKAIVSLILGVFSLLCCFAGILAIILGIQGLRETNRSDGRVTGRGLAIAGIVLGSIGSLLAISSIGWLLEGVNETHGVRRAQSSNNLKQAALAILFYHATYGSLPPAESEDADGRPLLSWRVAILPFLEEAAGKAVS